MKLFFKKTGEGKPLIILHGLFGLSDNWMTLAKKFGDNGFASYTPDLRNHGRSPHENEFNYQVMADDVFEFMSNEKISPAAMIGHSMGGKVAMFFAGAYPEKTDRLVVADIAPRYYSPHHDGVIAALRQVNLDDTQSRKEAEEHLRISIHDEATIQFLLKNLYWKEGNGGEKKLAWRFNLPAIEKNIDSVGEKLPDNLVYDEPVLFVRGERSGYVTSQDEPAIKKHFPKAQIKTIAGAGHWVHAEKPAEFFETVLEFLKS